MKNQALDFRGHGFSHVARIDVKKKDGRPVTRGPSEDFYQKRRDRPLHRFGRGPFGALVYTASLPALRGVYLVTVDQAPVYVGECVDLRRRWGPVGYGAISPRNMYRGGQSTNCKINGRILQAAAEERRIELWFKPCADHKQVEAALLGGGMPPWNSKG